MTNKKKYVCKHLCTDCEHYSKECSDFDATCKVYEEEIISCVDGTETIELAFCKNHNIDGCCKKYKPLTHLKLMRLLEQHLKTLPLDWACRDSVEMILITDLLKVLEGKDSEYFEEIYSGNTPYSHRIIVTKKAIEDSIDYRGYRLPYQEKGDCYGEFIENISKEEAAKTRSWLSKIKTLLGLKE